MEAARRTLSPQHSELPSSARGFNTGGGEGSRHWGSPTPGLEHALRPRRPQRTYPALAQRAHLTLPNALGGLPSSPSLHRPPLLSPGLVYQIPIPPSLSLRPTSPVREDDHGPRLRGKGPDGLEGLLGGQGHIQRVGAGVVVTREVAGVSPAGGPGDAVAPGARGRGRGRARREAKGAAAGADVWRTAYDLAVSTGRIQAHGTPAPPPP